MSTDKTRLEIGHVLFIDIVGYSKLLVKQQSELLRELNEVVSGTKEFREAELAGKLIRLPTGDGMALVFRTNTEAPVECAMEIARALKSHPAIQLRMGIHSGPVNEVVDVNQRQNIAGAGINMAQRVMDCGDAGHILVSKHVAEDLEQDERWRPLLHDLGTCEVKHGVRVGVTNLYSDEVGNSRLPKKLQASRRRKRIGWTAAAAVVVLLAAIALAFLMFMRKPTQSAAAVPEKSIAVLPFENLSEDKSNAYFADGIQDEILTKLAGITDLKVISRTSTAKYKSKPEDLKIVSQQLGVANVVEGTVQRAADKVRVNVQLIDARADTHLWAKSYDRDLKDVFAVESEVSQEIADALQAKLSPDEANTLATAPTRDPEAYDLFLKAEYEERDAESSLKGEPFDRAAAFYQQALSRDPTFALAAARLAENRILRHWFVKRLSDAELPKLKELADHAIALGPDLVESHIALGSFYYYGKHQLDQALEEFGHTLKVQPNNLRALELSAYVHRRQDQWQRALSELTRCAERDPQNSSLLTETAATYGYLRMWPETRRTSARALALNPNSLSALSTLSLSCLNGAGDMSEAKHALAAFSQPPRVTYFVSLSTSAIAPYLHVLDRDFSGALKVCDTPAPDSDEDRSRLIARIAIHLLAGDAAGAQVEIDKARELLEARLRERPTDSFATIQLAWVNLALDRRSEALRFAQEGVNLQPVDKDALAGPAFLNAQAQIAARAGEPTTAVKALQRLLAIPAGLDVSIAQLKIDPVWDPIRNDPGFQQLLAGKELVGHNK